VLKISKKPAFYLTKRYIYDTLLLEVMIMAVERLLVVLDPPTKNRLKEMSRRNKVSVSSIGRDLIKEALELHEGIYWDGVASEREKSFSKQTALTHKKVWRK